MLLKRVICVVAVVLLTFCLMTGISSKGGVSSVENSSLSPSDSVTEENMKIKVDKDTATIDDDDSFVSKLIAGCKGTVRIKTPFGVREINKIKKVKFTDVPAQ